MRATVPKASSRGVIGSQAQASEELCSQAQMQGCAREQAENAKSTGRGTAAS